MKEKNKTMELEKYELDEVPLIVNGKETETILYGLSADLNSEIDGWHSPYNMKNYQYLVWYIERLYTADGVRIDDMPSMDAICTSADAYVEKAKIQKHISDEAGVDA